MNFTEEKGGFWATLARLGAVEILSNFSMSKTEASVCLSYVYMPVAKHRWK
jgi:hypothetical protein